jgi:hypothetical protein
LLKSQREKRIVWAGLHSLPEKLNLKSREVPRLQPCRKWSILKVGALQLAEKLPCVTTSEAL